MSETHGDGNEHAHHPHHHACANLFGCGDEKGTGIIREDIKDAAFDNRASDTSPPYGRGRSGDFRRLSVGARPLAPQVPASKQLHGCARRGRAMVRQAGAGARVRRGAEARIPSWRPRARGSLDQGDGAARRLRRQLAAHSHYRFGRYHQLSRYLVALSQRNAAGRADRHAGEAARRAIPAGGRIRSSGRSP